MQCPLCADFSAPSLQLLLRHIGPVHSKCDGFKITCGIGLCKSTFRNFKRFRAHLKRNHGLLGTEDEPEGTGSADANQSLDNPIDSELDHDLFGDQYMETETGPHSELLRRALWILKLKEKRKLTQSALEEILQDVTELCTDLVTQLGERVVAALTSAGVMTHEVPGLLELFDSEKSEFCQPFHHLNTYHRQLSFYRANFNFVDPVQQTLGSRHVTKGTGSDRRVVEKNDTFVYVPLLDSIEFLLKDEAVLEEVMTGHERTDGVQEDYCDSPQFRENPLFSVDSKYLQLMLYYDDVEFCNPLGSKRKKHKLGCFYFMLGNLHPKHRSSLNSIQLLALVKVDLLNTYGMDKVLEPIIKDIQKLEKGVVFQSASGPLALRGTVTTVSADNLGSHALGGFKEGGRALRCCRHCMVPNDDMGSKLMEDQVVLRTPEDHQHQCQLLEGPLCDFFSTNYGITRDSLVNSLDFFHVCSNGLPPDIMHDILEGYLPYTVKLMLKLHNLYKTLGVKERRAFLIGGISVRLMSCFFQVTKLFIYQFVGSTITFQESAFCSQLEEHFGGAPDSRIFRTSSVQVHRMELKLGVVIVMGVDKEGTPQFMEIEEMFVDQCNKVLLGVKAMQVVEYNAHFHSWVIQVTTQKQLVSATSIFTRQVLTARTMRNAPILHKFVTFKFAV